MGVHHYKLALLPRVFSGRPSAIVAGHPQASGVNKSTAPRLPGPGRNTRKSQESGSIAHGAQAALRVNDSKQLDECQPAAQNTANLVQQLRRE